MKHSATIFSAIGLCLFAGCTSFPAATKNAQGVRLYQRARYTEARTHFEQAILDEPSHADAHYNLAVTCHKLGSLYRDANELARAENEYNLCLDFSPNHADCYRGLSVLLVETGRFDAATRLLKNWRNYSPASAEPPLQLARLYDEANQPQVALEYLLQAGALAPRDARVHAALGYLRERQGDLQQAMHNYRQSLAYRPKQPEIAARLATLRTRIACGSCNPQAGAPTSDATIVAGDCPTCQPTNAEGAIASGVIASPSTIPSRVGPAAPLKPEHPSYERTASSSGIGTHRL